MGAYGDWKVCCRCRHHSWGLPFTCNTQLESLTWHTQAFLHLHQFLSLFPLWHTGLHLWSSSLHSFCSHISLWFWIFYLLCHMYLSLISGFWRSTQFLKIQIRCYLLYGCCLTHTSPIHPPNPPAVGWISSLPPLPPRATDLSITLLYNESYDTTHLSEWLKGEIVTKQNAGKNAEELDHSCMAGGNVKW